MDKDRLVKMGSIPVIAESEIGTRQCQGCGNEAIFKLAVRVSDTQQQAISWCLSCAFDVMRFLEAQVFDLKEEREEE